MFPFILKYVLLWCLILLRPLLQNIIDWVDSTTDIYFPTVLEPRSLARAALLVRRPHMWGKRDELLGVTTLTPVWGPHSQAASKCNGYFLQAPPPSTVALWARTSTHGLGVGMGHNLIQNIWSIDFGAPCLWIYHHGVRNVGLTAIRFQMHGPCLSLVVYIQVYCDQIKMNTLPSKLFSKNKCHSLCSSPCESALLS